MPFNAPKLAQCWNVTFVIATEAPVMTKAGLALPLQSNTVSPKTPVMLALALTKMQGSENVSLERSSAVACLAWTA
jgi:hypothetical protein